MPWTLYRHILKELIKLLVLSTGVLMIVIGFGAAIPPLTEGVLGAGSLAKFVLFSMPTMLGFALPFGAVFAGTMVFCRMASDNEIVACRASGMSYRTILLPVVFLGLVLWISLFYMSNWVIPRFYEMAERQLEHDMTEVLISHVRQQQPMEFRRMVVYADAVEYSQDIPEDLREQSGPRPIRAEKRIELQGVTVGRFSPRGELLWEGSAQYASVLLFRFLDERQTWVAIRLRQVVAYDATGTGLSGMAEGDEAGEGQILEFEDVLLPPERLPNPFRDRLEFLSWPELQERGRRPELFESVRVRKANLTAAIASEQLLREISARLAASSQAVVEVSDPRAGHHYRISAPVVGRERNRITLRSAAGMPVRVDHVVDGVLQRRRDAQFGEINVQVRDPEPEPRISVHLENVRISDAQAPSRATEARSAELPGAYWPTSVMTSLSDLSIAELDRRVRVEFADSVPVQQAESSLTREIRKLARRITARLHARAASAVGAMLVLVLGALLSIQMRGSMPLAIYFWGFLTASVAVIITRSGENVVSSTSGDSIVAGLIVIWMGNVVILGAVAGVYWRLARN